MHAESDNLRHARRLKKLNRHISGETELLIGLIHRFYKGLFAPAEPPRPDAAQPLCGRFARSTVTCAAHLSLS